MPSKDQIPFYNATATSVNTVYAATLSTLKATIVSANTSGSAQSNYPTALVNFSSSINSTLNFPTNECSAAYEESYSTYFGELAVPEWEAILTVIVLSVFILLTIVGNILVILSVFTYKPLRIVQNFFIVSLAVADLTVALLVMPFNVAYSIQGRWEFGIHVCKMWLTSDVMCCTSSILNLCAIALDRYWAITDPINYAQKRTVERVLLLIAGVWILSLIISSPPLVGWNDWPKEFTSSTPCELTSNRGYVIYSSLGSFFIPLVIMTIVYIEIYVATRRRLRERAKASKINTFAIKSSDADVAGASVVSSEKIGDFRSFCGTRCCWGKDTLNIATPIIQHDQESFSSETNVNVNEMNTSFVEHRVVVVTQKKSRRAKIKDSIKHGKMHSSKYAKQTSSLENQSSVDSKAEAQMESSKKVHLAKTCFHQKDTDVEQFENSSESAAKVSAEEVHEKLGNVVDCVQNGDESTSLKITPPQSSTGAAIEAPVSKKPSGVYQFIEEKQKISLSKERRAARTLGIIMGVFVICWLPFFLMYVILPFCKSCCPTNKFKNFITWLGYINSGLNPVIYTIFNIEYRRAFKRLLRLE